VVLRCPVNNPAVFKPADAVSCNACACSGPKEEMSYTIPADAGPIMCTEGGFCGTTTDESIGWFVDVDCLGELPLVVVDVEALFVTSLFIFCGLRSTFATSKRRLYCAYVNNRKSLCTTLTDGLMVDEEKVW
jgi:hypothetical protein